MAEDESSSQLTDENNISFISANDEVQIGRTRVQMIYGYLLKTERVPGALKITHVLKQKL